MSSPADIELAEPSWLVEDSVTTETTIPTTVTSNDVIHAPSGATKPKPIGGSTSIDANTGNSNRLSAAEAASQKTWGEYFRESFQRDGRLLIIIVLILICMNIPFIKYALYPFTIYSTWIHEMCHGMAAIISGGSISKLQVFPNGSGLAYTTLRNASARGFVASAGYQGTAVVGFILLIFRRTKRGPRTGTMVLACLMLLSCMIWVRNVFGFAFIFCMGLVFAGLAWFLPSDHIRNLYIILAVTCSLNAISQVQNLFGYSMYVNGEEMSSDAHTMADVVGGSYLVWAILWFILSILMTILGILFAIPGPDEVADFKCCGVCQDLGCFKLCNYPGQRCWSRLRRSADDQNGTTSNNNDNDLEGP